MADTALKERIQKLADKWVGLLRFQAWHITIIIERLEGSWDAEARFDPDVQDVILVFDPKIESMTNREIEARVCHEMGHILLRRLDQIAAVGINNRAIAKLWQKEDEAISYQLEQVFVALAGERDSEA